MAFLAAVLWISDYFFQILKNPYIFYLFFLKINQFLHVYYTKFIKKKSLCTNFEFSQKFPVKSQIFSHIYLVPIMYEPWKLKKVTGNKILFRVIPEQCVGLYPWNYNWKYLLVLKGWRFSIFEGILIPKYFVG